MYPAIIKTLAYADIFDFPLTAKEIHRRLISQSATFPQIQAALKKSKLSQRKDFYFLKGRESIVSKRINAAKRTKQKIAKARRIARIIKNIPAIQAIYLTGAVAVGNAAKHDDIDLMIITSPGKLWQSRLITNTILDLMRIRRQPKSTSTNNQACLNLWLDTTNTKTKSGHQSLYTAYEIIQARPLVDKNNVHQLFLSQNRWLTTFLPNIHIEEPSAPPPPKTPPSSIETISFSIQNKIMQKNRTTERISLRSAFFHPRKTRQQIEIAYQKRLDQHL